MVVYALIWSDRVDGGAADDPAASPVYDRFIEWLWLDHQLHTRQTFAEYALAKHAADLGPGSRRFLRACADAPLRLLQIAKVEPGRVHVRDAIDRGPIVVVTEHAGSEQLVRHDVLAARIARYGNEWQFEGMNLRFGVDDKRWVAAQVRRMRKAFAREVPKNADAEH